ncbi:MAG: hypothetical protein JWR26_4840 [Pedosphaera sp.]|nr:hypothetical protein [Pedosphaera sp.]
MPAREVEICKRLRLYREKLQLSQVAFAREAGLDSSKLASYEHARAPLRYGAAFKIISAFLISPQWLASDIGPISSSVTLPSPEELGVNPEDLFSAVFDRKLSKKIETETAEFMKAFKHEGKQHVRVDSRGRVIAEMIIKREVHQWFLRVQDSRLNDFLNGLQKFAEEFIQSKPSDPPKVVEKRKREMESFIAAVSANERRLGKTD